jgi:hypothetical protein
LKNKANILSIKGYDEAMSLLKNATKKEWTIYHCNLIILISNVATVKVLDAIYYLILSKVFVKEDRNINNHLNC